jgi:hypothetical protein
MTTQPAAKPHTPLSFLPTTLGMNAVDFVRAHRVHVEGNSKFVDPYLVVHPFLLDPKNDAALQQHVRSIFALNAPWFFGNADDKESKVFNALTSIVPISAAAAHDTLIQKVTDFNTRVDSGRDAKLARAVDDKKAPFSSMVRERMTPTPPSPTQIDARKNGLTMMLLLQQKLKQQGFSEPLANYVYRLETADQVLFSLSDKLGVTPLQMREAALGGIDGVVKLLNLSPKYVADVKALVDYVTPLHFSANVVKNWMEGHALKPEASLADQLAAGLEARVATTISTLRTQQNGHYETPAAIAKQELDFAELTINALEPVQRVMLYKIGANLCTTSQMQADTMAKYKNINGLNRTLANDPAALGSRNIYVGANDNLQARMRTAVHEVAHNLWVSQFSREEQSRIDHLIVSDTERFYALEQMMQTKFTEFKNLVNAYKAGTPEEQKAIAASTATLGVDAQGKPLIAGVMLGYIADPVLFRALVDEAQRKWTIEGERYVRNGTAYDGTDGRMAEIISRFAEVKQVTMREQPELLHYLAPGLDDFWEQHYIPHLERVYASRAAEKITVPDAAKAADVAPVTAPVAVNDNVAIALPAVVGGCQGNCGGTCAAHATKPTPVVSGASIQAVPQAVAADRAVF